MSTIPTGTSQLSSSGTLEEVTPLSLPVAQQTGAQAGSPAPITYDSYKLYLTDGRRAVVWVAPGELAERRIARLLDQHGLAASAVRSVSIAGFRKTDVRPEDRITSF